MEKKFSLEHQYELYLKRIALTEEIMHPEQKIQTKQAFLGLVVNFYFYYVTTSRSCQKTKELKCLTI